MSNLYDFTTLHTILGDEGLLTAPQDMVGYETGGRGDKGKAAFIARPKNTAEVSAVVAACNRLDIPLIAQSGNTGLVNASIPNHSGTQGILSFDRMRKIITIDPDNRSAHVEAGLRLSALNQSLEQYNLFFPIDLSADPCLGGMCATNTGGGRFLKYSGVRENILGLTVVLPDKEGTILKLGGALHKNNTGLDLKQIFIGTGGQFGYITEIILKTAPRPQQSATALLIPNEDKHVIPLLRAFEEHCGDCLSAFEGMSANAMSRALSHVKTLHNPFGRDEIPPYAILVELSRPYPVQDDETSLPEKLERTLAALWDAPSAPLRDAIIGDPVKLWALRHSLSEGVQKSGKLYAFDISFKRGDVMAFLSLMHETLPRTFPNITICDFGHIGDGGVHFNLVIARDDPRATDPAFEPALRQWVLDHVVYDFHGSFSAEHGLGRKNAADYERYTAQEIKDLSRSIQNLIKSN